MSTRYSMELADGIDELFCAVAEEAKISKAEVVRKALQLFMVARRAIQEGDRVGVVDKNGELMTEFVGL